MDFYDRYVNLCAKNGITPSRAAIEIGMTKTAVSNWKARKTMPTDTNLKKLADYFGVSTGYLLGKENTATPKGDGKADEFISLYNRLDKSHQQAVRQLIESLLSSQ